MNASKLTIDPSLLDKKMTRAKKKLLREKLIKEYIRSRPYGVAIGYAEFSKIGRWASDPESQPFIKQMVREGQIIQEPIPGKRAFSYTVTGITTVTKTSFKDNLEELAKEFAWKEDSDSLREFIIYLKNRGTI